MKYKKGMIKCLFIVIPALLCAAIVSLAVFIPKLKTSSNKVETSSNKTNNSVSQTYTNLSSSNTLSTDASSQPDITQNKVKYRLVYALTDMRQATEGMPITRADDLFGNHSRNFVSQFEGQDVYFRICVSPVVFYEESKKADYTDEKGEQLKKQRIQYVIDLGAKDMVLVPNTSYAYYASLNAEMIKKIDERGECSMLLVNPPRPSEYHMRISDKLVYSLETMQEDETIAVKFSTDTVVILENALKPVDELFEKTRISDEQITVKDYKEETVTVMGNPEVYKRYYIEASLTKKQIKDIAPYINGIIYKTLDEDITIIDVTEDTKLPL